MFRSSPVRCAAACAALLAATASAGHADEIKITSDTFGGLHARAIGPAVMSGRIAALDAVASDPLTIYVGAATGGVWKSNDAGITFKPVFDKYTQSIGALRVDPSNAKTVWVGTGETWARNSVSIGDGVYKSTDAGDTWAHVGLPDSERIARIEVDPKASDTVFVCASGRLWSASEERGVFKTTDGGKSWKKALFVDADTGCSDLSVDPQDPRIVYAGMWTFRRYPDFFQSGGKGSGLYRSNDGGETWKRLEGGLPKQEMGRVAVAVAPSRPSVVYAIVELGDKQTGLYRSDDAGSSWREVNTSFNVQVRPFYFAHIVVDPVDFNLVYKPGLTLTISRDGGKAFNSPFGGGGFGSGPHSDHHAIWIHPKAPNLVLLGTDGGLYQSNNRGGTWQFFKNLPLSQLYHVAVDGQDPYRVYGGLQDNASWVAPSASWGGIENKDWTVLSGGDGFWTFADGNDPDIIYTEIQEGDAVRVDLRTGESKDIKPFARPGDEELRFNWNTAFVTSPTDPKTLYLGAQYLFRSRDRGETWERISPDLTTDDPERQRQAKSGGLSIDNSSAENNTTIYTVSESPKNPQLIWVGTDDGNLQLTRDGGKTWQNVIRNVPGATPGTWISRVAASRFDEGTAYLTIDDHRRGDLAPHVYRTTDFGASWQSLVTPNLEGYAWVIGEDTVRRDLLFLGTELGLWISVDGGKQWARFDGGIPAKVAVHDLVVHPREGDLVIATHGRGIYILDDLTPLRALSAETLAADAALVPSRPAVQRLRASIGSWFSGDDEFVGRNPSNDASIVYWLKKRHLFGDLKVEVFDADGKLLATIPGSKRVGINRVGWETRLKPPKVPPAAGILFGGFEGPRLPEGTYRVKLTKGKETYEGQVQLVADPRNPHSAEDRRLKQQTDMRLYDDIERLGYVGDSLVAVRDSAKERAGKAKGALAKQLEKLAADSDKLRNSFVAEGDVYIGGDEKLRERVGVLYGNVLNFEGRPSPSQLERAEILEREIAKVEQQLADFVGGPLKSANTALGKQQLPALELLSREAWKAKEQSGGKPPAALDPKSAAALLAAYPQLADFAQALLGRY